MSVAQTVGDNVRRIRLESGATLEDVAKALRAHGCATWSSSAVSNLEHGRVSPTIPTLFSVAQALGQIRQSPLRLAELLSGAADADLMRFASGQPAWPTVSVSDLPSEAEVRLARRLGVPPETVVKSAKRLYGMTAPEERDRRAGSQASAQKRGRIMRQIERELRAAL